MTRGPGPEYPAIAPNNAAASPTTESGPRTRFWSSLNTASRNMISVPNSVRMISGRTRKYSALVGRALTGIGDLFHGGNRIVRGNSAIGLIENARVLSADRRHETLREGAHPDHQQQERQNRSPLAPLEVGDVMADGLRWLSEECPLVKPEHVAGRQNHPDRGEHDPSEIHQRGALQH